MTTATGAGLSQAGHTRILAILAVLVALAAGIIAVGLTLGTRPLSPAAALAVLVAPDGKLDSILVWTLRLPRSLAAFVGGAGLAVSGYLLQTLTRNPLAGPGLTGVSAGRSRRSSPVSCSCRPCPRSIIRSSGSRAGF